jgi:hypothetical protein
MTLFFLLLILTSSVGAAALFKKYVGRSIKSDVLRISLVGFVFSIALAGGICGAGALVFSAMYPTTNHPIDDTYAFSEQPYGFATTASNGYLLTFYRTHSFLPDEQIGAIDLECMGTEQLEAEIVNGRRDYNRLILKVNQETALDTMLHFDQPFHFKRRAYPY